MEGDHIFLNFKFTISHSRWFSFIAYSTLCQSVLCWNLLISILCWNLLIHINIHAPTYHCISLMSSLGHSNRLWFPEQFFTLFPSLIWISSKYLLQLCRYQWFNQLQLHPKKRVRSFILFHFFKRSFMFTIKQRGSYRDIPHMHNLPHHQHYSPEW